MSTLTRAIVLAAQHHEGQTDKGGNPYILHPLRLMLQASTDEERIVALLHDVVEDTALTLDELRREGFSEQIVEAIDRLTRQPDETYDRFIERIKGNELACRVKILDLEDNCSEKGRRQVEQYHKALCLLRDLNEPQQKQELNSPVTKEILDNLKQELKDEILLELRRILNQPALHQSQSLKISNGTDLPQVLTVKQVAVFLGWHPNTVYQRCKSGELPSFKSGNLRRIRRESFLSWIETLTNK